MTSRATAELTPRMWVVVLATALSLPLGSLAAGLVLARVGEATVGGMASLAGAVIGLWLGGPLAAVLTYLVGLVTVVRGVPLRHVRAMLVMLATGVLTVMVALVGLRLAVGISPPELGTAVVGLACMTLVGAGAFLGLRLARR